MAQEMEFPAGFSGEDILFECPACGKSLGINEQGAGLIVRCPDCGTRMQVPVPERLQGGVMTTADYTQAPSIEDNPDLLEEKVQRLEVSVGELEARKRFLEKLRIDHALRFERIREEMAIVQGALDRMVDILQDVGQPPSGDAR